MDIKDNKQGVYYEKNLVRSITATVRNRFWFSVRGSQGTEGIGAQGQR